MQSANVIKKIPGNIPPPSKKENQGYIDDLSKKQKFELEELLERQNKILNNKDFLAKLPDKGKKLIIFRDKVSKELLHRNEVDKAANLLSRLNIASEGKEAMNKLEWTGKYSDEKESTKVIQLDSDDEEEDPLKILAQPTGTGVHKKKVIQIQPEESLIKPEDIKEIESFKTKNLESNRNEEDSESDKIENQSNLEHVKYIVDKVENCNIKTTRESFKPYRTTKSNVHDPMKERERKYKKNWEITAATPPHIIHGAVKAISLNESLLLQKEQADKLQEIQIKHATEKLTQQLGGHMVGPLPKNVGTYRTRSDSSASSANEEEKETYDDEDEDKGGTVSFAVSDHENLG